MAVTFELPRDIEAALRKELGNLDEAAKQAALIELYRQHMLTHHQLAQALGISRFEVDAILKGHGVSYDLTFDEICQESESLRPHSNE